MLPAWSPQEVGHDLPRYGRSVGARREARQATIEGGAIEAAVARAAEKAVVAEVEGEAAGCGWWRGHMCRAHSQSARKRLDSARTLARGR
eukprot:scaffold23546_cov63-Phaeocystis_antarctica.AAC.1